MNRDWQNFKALYGNIEGAREGFEKACETLFRKVYSSQHVSQMAVKQGDGGIDIFVGEFGIEPIIVIQCKFFLESFGDSQKAQIRESFNRAKNSDKYELREWILAVPRVIDIDENSWWFKWKENQDINIRLINGNELIDLMKEENVYNQVFQMEDSLILRAMYDDSFFKREEETLNELKKILSWEYMKTIKENSIDPYYKSDTFHPLYTFLETYTNPELKFRLEKIEKLRFELKDKIELFISFLHQKGGTSQNGTYVGYRIGYSKEDLKSASNKFKEQYNDANILETYQNHLFDIYKTYHSLFLSFIEYKL